MPTLTPIEIYAFEIIERVIRFNSHLEAINDEFFKEKGLADKQDLVHEYKDCLTELFHDGISLMTNPKGASEKDLFKKASNIMNAIVTLHEECLFYLPRPTVPVELRRFTRILDNQHPTKAVASISPRSLSDLMPTLGPYWHR